MTTSKRSDANDTTANDAAPEERTPAKSPRKTAAKKAAPAEDSGEPKKKTPARTAKTASGAKAKAPASKSAAKEASGTAEAAQNTPDQDAPAKRGTAKSAAATKAAKTPRSRKSAAKDADAPDSTPGSTPDSTPDSTPGATEISAASAPATESAAKTPRKTASGTSRTARGRKSAAATAGDTPPAEAAASAVADASTAADAPAAAPKKAAPSKSASRSRSAAKSAGSKSAPARTASSKTASVSDDAAASAAPAETGPVTAAPEAQASASASAGQASESSAKKTSGGRSRRSSSGRGRSGASGKGGDAKTDAAQAAMPAGDASAPSAAASVADAAQTRAAMRDAPRDVLPDTPQDAAQDAAQDGGPADFPTGFDDLAPEDYFASQDGESAEPGEEQNGKKRRSRSRRGGRGRKKSQAAAASSETAAPAADAGDAAQDDAAEEPADFDDFDDAYDDDLDGPETAEKSGQKRGKEDKGLKSRRKMFVSVLPEEQIEVVITEEGQVQEYYVEMLHQAKTKGNIYKATVHNVDPNLQAAFVSYGAVKNGFLQIDEVHPEYYVAPHDANKGRKYPPIQKVLKPGQELLVQVVKEPAGTKGAFLTTYLSMPGRFLVLTPGREQIGVSRKVDDDGERARLRELLEGLSPGPGLGVIVRTVSMGASKTSLQRDLQFLKRTWKDVRAKGTTEKAPCLVYQEMDLTSRAVRDYLTDAIGEVWIDDEATAGAVTEIAEALFPRKSNLVRLHKDPSLSLFERFNLQRQLDQIHSREVTLPSGGRLVIDPTEALTAIDINSGRSSGKNNFEDMAYRTNMEAAKMIPLQLRLRDIGGQIVADFIEMRDKSHWREVEKTLRNGMKVDRARYDVGKIGPFGLLEIVRQRLGSSAISISTEPCPCCNGTGVRRNMEWQSQSALRDILRLVRGAQAQNQASVTYETDQGVAMHLLNHKRQRLLDMEQQYGVHLDIKIRVSSVE